MTGGPLFELNARTVFGNSWFVVGHECELNTKGMFKTVRIMDQSLLLIRGEESIGCFYNVCIHRGCELMTAGTGAAAGGIVCPFHNWRYSIDGAVSGRPGSALRRVPLVNFHGFLFICLNDRLGFEDFFDVGFARPFFESRRAGAVSAGSRVEDGLEAGWDAFVESHLDYEHIDIVHKNFGKLMGRSTSYDYRENVASIGYAPTETAGTPLGKLMKWLAQRRTEPVMEFHFFPCSFFEFYHEMMIYYSYVPMEEPGRSRLFAGFISLAKRTSLRGGLQSMLFRYVQNQGFREDEEIVKRLERGRASYAKVGEELTEHDADIEFFRDCMRRRFMR